VKLLVSGRSVVGTFLVECMRQIKRALRLAIVILPALMFVGMMRLIRRVFIVRIAPATSLRIGHLIQTKSLARYQ